MYSSLYCSANAMLIVVSYTLGLSAAFCLPSRGALQKVLGTCESHLGVIYMFYLTGIFTMITQHGIMFLSVHILLGNVCMLAAPLMLNPIIYGVKTRQIQKHVVSTLSSEWKHC